MDPSLLDLLQDLESVQAKKTEAHLSERNVVELVSKLKALGLLSNDLLYTTNGREYVTRQALEQEVEDLVHKEHRVQVVELPNTLNVDLVHCKAAAEAVGRAPDANILLAQGELFASSYFTGLVAEIAGLLEDRGLLSLGELAQTFGLGSDFLQAQLSPHIGGPGQAKLDDGYLYNPSLGSRLKAQLRGALRAVQSPLAIASLLNCLGYAGNSFVQRRAPSIIENLISQGRTQLESCMQGGTVWVPAVYSARQAERARHFYSQNGYIDWSMIRRLTGEKDAKKWAARECPGGTAMEEAYIGPAVLSQLEATLDEVLSAESWVDTETVLLPALSASDRGELVTQAVDKLGHLERIQGTPYIVSSALWQRLVDEATLIGRETPPMVVKVPKKVSTSVTGSKKGKTAERAEDDDDWSTTSGTKKKGGKKGRAAKKPTASAKEPCIPSSVPDEDDEVGRSSPEQLSIASLSEKMTASAAGEYAGLGAEPALVEALAVSLRATALAAFAEAERARRASGAERLRLLRERYSQASQQLFEEFSTYAAATAALFGEEDQGAQDAVERHLLRTLGVATNDALLRFAGVDSLSEEQVAEATQRDLGGENDALPELSQAERIRLAEQAGPAAGDVIQLAVSGKRVEDFAAALKEAGNAVGLWFRDPDKKRQKEILERYMSILERQLVEAHEAPAILAVAVPLLVARVCHKAVRLPGRALAPAIRSLEGETEPEMLDLLSQVHAGVLAALKGDADGGSVGNLAQKLQQRLLA